MSISKDNSIVPVPTTNVSPLKSENVELANTFFGGVEKLLKESNRHTEESMKIVASNNGGGKEVIYETTESHKHQHNHQGIKPFWLLLVPGALLIGSIFGWFLAPKPKPQAPLGDTYHSLQRLVGDEQRLCRKADGVVLSKSVAPQNAVPMTANDCGETKDPEALKKELQEIQKQFPYSLPNKQ